MFTKSPFIGSPFITQRAKVTRMSDILFANGEQGILLDLSPATVFQDSDMTTPAVAGDPVGAVLDVSGNDYHLTQATSLSKPTLTSEGYLIFDRVDDNLSVMIPASGIQGSMILGTTEGIVVAEVDIPEGEWKLLRTSGSGLEVYFPPGYFVGLILRQGVMSASEIAQAKNWLVSRGAKIDFGTSTLLSYMLGLRPEITGVNVSNWNTSKVASFYSFVYGCSSLQTLDVSNWNTSKVASFNSFARGCTSLQTLDVSNWDISKVTSFHAFVYGCRSLQTLDVSNWNTSEVTSFQSFAYSCTSLQTLDVSNWNTRNVTSFHAFVYGCRSLQTLDVSNWNTRNVTSFSYFARGCTSLQTLDVSNWNTSKVTDFYNFADGCISLQTLIVGNAFSDSPCTSYSTAFVSCALNQQSVDDILVAINAAGTSNGTLEMHGGTSSPPSMTGLLAKAELEIRGWAVTVNGTATDKLYTINLSDEGTVFQDSAGTIPATVGDPIGMIQGNGFTFVQDTTLSKPTLRQDANGKYYLEFDGNGDIMTATFPEALGDCTLVFAGAEQISAMYPLNVGTTFDLHTGPCYGLILINRELTAEELGGGGI